MLAQVNVAYTDDDGTSLYHTFPILGVTPKEPLIVSQITGLTPVDFDLFVGDYARNGGIYQGRRVGVRNIVMHIDMNPDPALGHTVSGLRKLLSNLFVKNAVRGEMVRMVFIDVEGHHVYTEAYTEKFETEIFSKETMVQVSLLCPDPYFNDVSGVNLQDTNGWVSLPIEYTGDVEVGLSLELEVVATPTAGTIKVLLDNGQTMTLIHDFASGDVITINTQRGSRGVTLRRGSSTTSILGSLSPDSRWLEVGRRNNVLSTTGLTSATNPAVIKKVVYRPKHGGL